MKLHHCTGTINTMDGEYYRISYERRNQNGEVLEDTNLNPVMSPVHTVKTEESWSSERKSTVDHKHLGNSI